MKLFYIWKMSEIKNQKNKFIFTDSFRTKDILWEAYSGFIDSYHDYKMLASIGRIDPINEATMYKYALYFYNEIEDFLDSFEREIQEISDIKKIFEQKEIDLLDYAVIRRFFAKFMKVSGIKNIVKEKDEAGNSVLENR